MAAILEVAGLEVKYDEFAAVKDVNISIPTGEAVALLGPNGAGKTSLLKALSGVLPISQGVVKLFEEDVTGKPSHILSRQGIALIPEGRLPFGSMNVKENLLLPAYSQKMSKKEIDIQLEFIYSLFPRLKERSNQKAENLSGGEQQMMVIGRALMMKPKILLIDEPSLGLAPIIVEQIYEVIPKLLDSGISILLVEQSSTLALSVCSTVNVMREGKIIYSGNSGELSHDDLTNYYLG